MSGNPGLAESQLLELLEQLKKTTPESAKQILNSQPGIAYALITMMVNMGAVNTEVFQKILAAYGAQQAQAQTPLARGTPRPSLQPAQNVYPPRGPTPSGYPSGPSQGYPGYPQQRQPANAPPYPSFGYPSATPTPVPMPDGLVGIPEEQKAMIMRVLQMTPDQINALPPAERGSIMQLRAAMGVSG
ncbi:hypothetical protein BDV98DRAFT_564025 [Pterulicium gracile]|uniref:Cleavage stimulation factor subunit 2 hinge domain-containing protein n=1 Tax=Pterulicium gracile TaxID=1884261 RepID=A0A5C3QMY2_9AGAR|nr:hypothetical protein BDV98DRAFT_564025 [Pterula gracilis]